MSSHSPEPEPLDTDQQAIGSSASLASLLAAAGGGDLSSLLAARAGEGSPDDLGLASLLAAGTSAPSGDTSSALLQNLAMRWLEQRASAPADQAADEPDEDPELDVEEMERRRQRILEKRQQMLELRHVLTSLYDEVETLRARNDALAAALGACYLCFGEDPDCPECSGNGVPGARSPDASAFRQYIVPALRRVRATRSYRRPDIATRKEGNGARDQTSPGRTDDSAP